MADKKKLVAGLQVETGNSVQNIEAVQTALVKSGPAGVQSANQITSGLQAIEDGAEKALKKVASGSQVSDAELQKLAHDEAAWVPLWQQHDLYGVAGHVEWAPRADEKVWMYDAKVAP